MSHSHLSQRWLRNVLATGALLGLLGVNLLASGSANIARATLINGQVLTRALSAPNVAQNLFGPRGPTALSKPYGAEVILPAAFGTVDSLRGLAASAAFPSNAKLRVEEELNILPKTLVGSQKVGPDGALQETPGTAEMLREPIANFDGLSIAEAGGYLPPDTNGDIGYDPSTGKRYYFEWVNVFYEAWDVTDPLAPVVVISPTAGNTLWAAGLPGTGCANNNDGDPIVLFDEQAHRWLVTQFDLGPAFGGPFHECIAVSQTPDPAGAWWVYQYDYRDTATYLNDYPHFGVWPDPTYNAYYMTVHQFNASGSAWLGQAVGAFDRAKLLAGDAAAPLVMFDLFGVNPNFGGMLPADLDGAPPPNGTPGLFFEVDDDTAGMGPDALRVWEFRPNWVTPASSTFGISGQPNYTLPVAAFNLLPCTTLGARTCIPQLGTPQRLDAIGDRLMHRVAFRQVGGQQVVVLNHTVWADGTDRAGVRWYEARRNPTTGAWNIHQQGTYAPVDDLYRWMGSAAMDTAGNMALGYSVAGSTSYPAIRYVGRTAGDPLNTLPQTELTITTSSGAQTHFAARWGDYSMLGVDPEDGCTFWYAQEYHGDTASAAWRTRIASFKFDNCSRGPVGYLTGTVTNLLTTAPIANATVQARQSSTQTYSALTDASGMYTLTAPPGLYTVTASALYYTSSTAVNVSIVVSATTVQNFALRPRPALSYHGLVVSGGDGDGYLEPNETANIQIGLHNLGLATATAVNATLVSNVVHATVLNAHSAYPNLAPGAVQTNTTPYQVHLDAGYPCGTPLNLRLNVSSTLRSYIFNVPVPTGPPAVGLTYPSADVPLPIPDNPTVTSTLTIPDNFSIVDVNVTLNLNHTWDSDLDIYLVAPSGTRVELTTDNGSSADNYLDTTFDDEAATAITAGMAPFTGRYRPEGTLASLDGQNAAGVWRLEIEDDTNFDSGTLNAWSLNIDDGQSPCDVPAPRLVRGNQFYSDIHGDNDGYIFPGENNLEAYVTLSNTGTLPAANVTTTLVAQTAGVTVITPTVAYGTLASGAAATNATPFGFNVSSTVACGSRLRFSTRAYADEGFFNLGSFTFPVGRRFAYTYTNAIPVPIPDLSTATSVIHVAAAPYNIADVNVLINLNHTYAADLQIYLVSPSGTRVELTSNNGGSGDHYTNTLFDDEAVTPITAGVPPFTGAYRPELPLSRVDQQSFLGNWTLEMRDVAGADVGVLNNWELRFAVAKCGDLPYLALNKAVSAASIEPAQLLTYTLVAHNTGDLALHDLSLTDPLPANATFVSASDGGTLNNGNVTWLVNNAPAGVVLTRTLVVQVSATAMVGDFLANAFSASSPELALAHSNWVTTTVVATPTLLVSPNPLLHTMGVDHIATRTLTLENTGLGSTLVWTATEGAHTFFNLPPTDVPPAARADPASAQEVATSAPADAPTLTLDPTYRPAPATPLGLLYDNGPLVNSPGTGAGGADESVLQDMNLGMSIFGFGHQVINNNSVADDFTISDAAGWYIDSFEFYAYQTGSGTASSITEVRYQIWDGPPNAGGSIIYGDLTTNRLISSTFANLYRVTQTTSGNTQRPVMRNVVAAGMALPAGTYWIEWTANGNAGLPGPWVPPVTLNGQTTTGNSLQNLAGAWSALVDIGPQGLPFKVWGALNLPECAATTDTPWLTVAQTHGTLLGGHTQAVDVIFNTTGLTDGSTYTSTICVASNAPAAPLIAVPITLTLSGTYGVTALPVTDTLPGLFGAVVTYSVWLTNTGNTTDTFDLNVANTPAFTTTLATAAGPLGPGQSTQVWVAVKVPLDVVEGMTSTAHILVSSQGGNAATTFSLTTRAWWTKHYLPYVMK